MNRLLGYLMVVTKYRRMIANNVLFRFSWIIDYPLVPPDVIQLNFLYRCNLKCRMCKMRTKDSSTELPLGALKKLIEEAHAMKIKQVLLLGGEPFLGSYIFELIKHISVRGMTSIVVTNGTLLTNELSEKIKESGLSHIVVSLDGSNENVLSPIRGPWVFDKIIANVCRFQEFKKNNKDFHTELNSCITIMNQNIEDLYNIVILSRKIGFNSVVFQPVVPDNTNQIKSGNTADTNIPPEKMGIMEESLNRLIEFKKSGVENYNYVINSVKNLELIKKYFKGQVRRPERLCYVGFNRFQISQDSKVYFCVPLKGTNEVSFGNIQKDSIKDIWYSSKAREFRKQIKHNSCCCMQRCAYRDNFEQIESLFEKIDYFRDAKL